MNNKMGAAVVLGIDIRRSKRVCTARSLLPSFKILAGSFSMPVMQGMHTSDFVAYILYLLNTVYFKITIMQGANNKLLDVYKTHAVQ